MADAVALTPILTKGVGFPSYTVPSVTPLFVADRFFVLIQLPQLDIQLCLPGVDAALSLTSGGAVALGAAQAVALGAADAPLSLAATTAGLPAGTVVELPLGPNPAHEC